MNEVEKVIFITHPAWPVQMLSENQLQGKEARWTSKMVRDFFHAEIVPQIAPSIGSAVVVLVKSPPVLHTEKPTKDTPAAARHYLKPMNRGLRMLAGHSISRERKVAGTEKYIRSELEKMFGFGRTIVVEGEGRFNAMPEKIAADVRAEIARRNIRLAKPSKVTVEAYGAFNDIGDLEQCRTAYPKAFAGRHMRLHIPERGGIPNAHRIGNFGPSQPPRPSRGNPWEIRRRL